MTLVVILAAVLAASQVGATPLMSLHSPSTFGSPSPRSLVSPATAEGTVSTANLSSSDTSSPLIAASWIQGWKTNDTTLSKLSFSKYTHMTYGFAEPQNINSLDLSKNTPGSLERFVTLAKHNNVSAIISIGGWLGSTQFSDIVSTPENRTVFANSIIDLASNYSLDGIELDWEYPNDAGACNVNNAADAGNLLALVQMLRNSSFGQHHIITSTVSGRLWTGTQTTNDTNIIALADALDYISIMNYDVFGQGSPFAGPNAPLHDSCASTTQQKWGFSADRAVRSWNDAGVPLNKLVLGMPTYGHSFSVSAANATNDNFDTINSHPGFNASQHPLGSQDNPSNPTFVDVCGVREPASGDWDFAGLVDEGYLDSTGAFIANQTKTSAHWMFDNCAQTPILYDEHHHVWISYDDPRSFRAKGEFIKGMGLKGFALFEAYGDVDDAMLDAVRSGAGLES